MADDVREAHPGEGPRVGVHVGRLGRLEAEERPGGLRVGGHPHGLEKRRQELVDAVLGAVEPREGVGGQRRRLEQLREVEVANLVHVAGEELAQGRGRDGRVQVAQGLRPGASQRSARYPTRRRQVVERTEVHHLDRVQPEVGASVEETKQQRRAVATSAEDSDEVAHDVTAGARGWCGGAGCATRRCRRTPARRHGSTPHRRRGWPAQPQPRRAPSRRAAPPSRAAPTESPRRRQPSG